MTYKNQLGASNRQASVWSVLSVLLTVTTLGLLTGCGSTATATTGAAANTPQSAKLDRGMIQATARASGRIETERQIMLSFASPGKVSKVLVKVGDAVHQGQHM